jgi:Ca-activated chloride channel family protein
VFFDDGWLLWILVPLWVAWAILWAALPALRRRFGERGDGAVRFSSIKNLKRLRTSSRIPLRRMVQGLRLVTVLLVVIAMARPQTGRTHTKVHTEGIDIVLALDTSGSMQALDLDGGLRIAKRRNRLQVVKDVVAKFIEKRETDQIGMVVFGEEAFTQCPLTLDHGIVATFLDRVSIGMAGDRTAVGDALGTAVKRLTKSKAKSKVVILLTDGRNNAGSLTPRKAAEVAAAYDVKVYTIGAGTRGPAPFLQEGIFGTRVVHQEVSIDEATLEAIADITGGAYFRAEDSVGLSKIYDQIDQMEKTEIEMEQYMEYNERFAWLVIPAIFLLLLEVLLLGTVFRKIP